MRTAFYPLLVNGTSGDPALYVELVHEGRAFLFDLGELRALAPRRILRLTDVFVSHAHVDHFIGFDWLLRICVGRDKHLRLYGPPGFVDQVAHKLAAYTWNLVANYADDLLITVTEYDDTGALRRARFSCHSGFGREDLPAPTAGDLVLLDEPDWQVRAAVLDHKIPCLAFALEEKVHVNVWKSRVAEFGVPLGPWLRALKQAALRGDADDTPFPIHWQEGGQVRERQFPVGELKARILHFTPGQKIAYVTDAAYHVENVRRIATLAHGADMLFIEAMFRDADRARAAAKCHLTARQAGTLARLAGAKSVVPFHFSARYEETARLEEEVRAAFAAGGAQGDDIPAKAA